MGSEVGRDEAAFPGSMLMAQHRVIDGPRGEEKFWVIYI